jgi:AcrR family transcriptional regulator/DNA-binding MarR family transcriptional regulator
MPRRRGAAARRSTAIGSVDRESVDEGSAAASSPRDGAVGARDGSGSVRDGSGARDVDGMARLRDGRGEAFARDQVDEIQRSRVLGALGEVVADHGVGAATVAQIVARAGVSRRTFYELFADREECFLAAFDDAVAVAARRVAPAFQAEGRWRERVRAGLLALLAFLDEEPALGELCVVHALGAGPDALEHRARVVRALVAAVEEGRSEARQGHDVAPLAAEGAVGAVLAVLHTRLSRQTGEPLSALAGPLMSMIVLPYLGSAAADRELARPAPKPAVAKRKRVREDPLQDLDMRLTYRTVRVLMAIAARPGASNRHVGGAAGIADQGQTSKLLQRLEHLGLIQRPAVGGGKGEPNAWMLTPRGQQLHDTIQTQSNPER